jgi:chemotaxis protein methyltransferase CheR
MFDSLSQGRDGILCDGRCCFFRFTVYATVGSINDSIRVGKSTLLSDNEFRQLLDAFNRPWRGYRKVRKGVKKRVRRHMSALGCRTIEEYLQLLYEKPEERAQLEGCLLVTISRFYRDQRLWETLSDRILLGLVEQFEFPIRIWSAGCANGEEPFSVAMAWDQAGLPSSVDILATDAKSNCLVRARKGVYPRSSLKNLSKEMRVQYFVLKKGGRRYFIQMDRLPTIRWLQHNLLTTPTETVPFHMIFLRNNLLTYFQGSAVKRAIDQILEMLIPGGYLVTGSHERLPDTKLFMSRDKICPWIYRLEKSV